MLADLMEAWEPSFSELEDTYEEFFSLSYLNTTLENKFGLISLICFLTKQARKNNPDATCYQVIMKVTKDTAFDKYRMKFIRGLAIVCEDFMKNTVDFMTFDLKSSKEMIKKINEILDTWMPF